MHSIKKILRYITDVDYRFLVNANRGKYNNMPDREYLSKRFKARLGYPLNLDNPITFNEKLQWLKLYDRRPEYTTMVDKYAVKRYVADTIGVQYIIPTLGVWDRFEDIDFDKLPNQFVLKCTHDSGGLVVCKDKTELNRAKAKKKIERCLKNNYFYLGREWPYMNVKPRIIAEVYMRDDEVDELKDYKFMAFNGEIKCSFVCSERFSDSGLRVTFFDNNWNVMPFERHYPRSSKHIPKPQCYEEMKVLAEKLAQNIPFVRVDFYEVSGKIYFGELTFYPGSGLEEFSPFEWDKKLGKWLKLPDIK
ncbi:MAG TPA: ATP-grasp fold amidoligase family protein [Ruminococcus sp.]|nr:ATP-grasp fold amidoligase family protein [Ruminococcus sp.]